LRAFPHYLLGFDARTDEKETAHTWPLNRREAYLLRQDVSWPISLDRGVWPSLFRFGTVPRADSLKVITVVPQTFLQEAIDLWDSLAAMQRALVSNSMPPRDYVRIAIELCTATDLVEDPAWNFLASSLPTDQIPRGWRVVGHDIADRDFVSGLSNCSYNERDRVSLSGWAQKINEFGLIDDVELAQEFREISDARLPDHAPFFVYRIHADIRTVSETRVRIGARL
jgi:hypothetical protein